ncbi:MAG: hypothetical protein ACT4PP_06825 [Sporichthyaceae bacterium]
MIRRQWAVACVAVALGLGALAGCGSDQQPGENITAIDVRPGEVASVTFTAAGTSAQLRGVDGIWAPGPGASAEAATLMSTFEERIFPLNAYRILPAADLTDTTYGLVSNASTAAIRARECGAGCAMEVLATDGRRWELSVGGRSFNQAGFYAAIAGDPRLYLLLNSSVADIISLATGLAFAFPQTDRLAASEAVLAQLNTEKDPRLAPENNRHPYLRQVLAAEADERAARQGEPGGALRREATSTVGQIGAPDTGAARARAGAGSALPGSSTGSEGAAPPPQSPVDGPR